MLNVIAILRSINIDNIRSKFTYYHVIKVLDLIERLGPMGRHSISKILGIGEGSARNLIRRLNSIGLVSIDPIAGAILAEKGKEILVEWRRHVSSSCVENINIVNWRYASISKISMEAREILMRNRSIIDLRDELVKKGCLGGLFIEVQGDKVMLLNTRGEPDYDISRTNTGEIIRNNCEGFCIVSGSDKDCLAAEFCIWELLIEIFLKES